MEKVDYKPACGGFAAEQPAGRTFRSTAAGAGAQQQRGAAARRSAANAGRVVLTAELTMLNTSLFIYGKFLFQLCFCICTRISMFCVFSFGTST